MKKLLCMFLDGGTVMYAPRPGQKGKPILKRGWGVHFRIFSNYFNQFSYSQFLIQNLKKPFKRIDSTLFTHGQYLWSVHENLKAFIASLNSTIDSKLIPVFCFTPSIICTIYSLFRCVLVAVKYPSDNFRLYFTCFV